MKSKLGYAEVKVSENKISESEAGSSYSMNSYGGVIARSGCVVNLLTGALNSDTPATESIIINEDQMGGASA